jgi:hypothetical protein
MLYLGRCSMEGGNSIGRIPEKALHDFRFLGRVERMEEFAGTDMGQN